MSNESRPAQACIEIDAALDPIYVITMIGSVPDEGFDRYLARLTELTRLPRARAFVYDARRAVPATPSQRKKQANWMKQHEAQVRSHTAGIAFVLPNALMRGVLTAVFWLQPLACPHLVTVSLEEGLRWVQQKLDEHARGASGQRRAT